VPKLTITYKQVLLSYALWWSFWGLVQMLVLHRLGLSWSVALIDALVANLLLGITGYITENTYRFYRPGFRNWLNGAAWTLALTGLNILAVNFILQFILSTEDDYLQFLNKSLPVRFGFTLLMVAFMTLLSWLWFYIADHEVTMKRKLDTEQLLREAELSKLRQQLQPHFLFNSLNSISSLAGSKPEAARKMIQQLSDFLRSTLKKDEQQLVTLEDELKHLNLYLEIEKVRFGHRLNTAITHDTDVLKMKLPSLLLQPVVENAIKFGLYDTLEEITISISAKKEDSNLVILVTNPFDPSTSKIEYGVGFGLSSLQKRLNLTYSRNDLLSIEQKENLFITKLNIPQLG